ncbi:PREDICTED: probable inorganic phosphate transporter 1-2 [Fragaria vesca subsp. vesca]|uniref:probable inorganic phosphate transporter 1-2 n=1 Tax=Fragaria vesca subsp. vesca TaxID=101020 RepID=UPI0002C3133C|nr:PREDICTED: probable inorganic phosphate transporter 1-2 [Fragaria vesca subsp. vesca]
MAEGRESVFTSLDNAKTQLYHYKAIVIAGMGFFTDAYDLFCITAVTKLIGRLYFYDPSTNKPGVLPPNINNAITGVALFGTLAGQLFFGWLGDKLGRKKVYGITLVTMVGCALASGLSFGSSPKSVVTTLCFFRFWLGFGIGGDYPLSAVIMSEYANTKTRGGFVAAVFAMQGVGILVAGAVALVVSRAFMLAFPADNFHTNNVLSTQPEGDFVWRIVLMFGAIPAALTFYWRLKMPETARYTALVKGDHDKAAADMAKVLEKPIDSFPISTAGGESETPKKVVLAPSSAYGLFSRDFVRIHGLHLVGTTSTWFLLDIAFYSLQLTQKDIYPSIRLLPKSTEMNAIEEVYLLSKSMLLMALATTVPGYWFTVFLIDRIGRFPIQLGGFILMSIFMAILGFEYEDLRGEKCPSDSRFDYCKGNRKAFAVLYGLTLFFANFGPNSTTFIVPAELFPARLRSTCHGISAAAGKAGAIIGAFVVQSYTQEVKGVKRAIRGLAFVNLLGVLFTLLVPETMGRSLEEISGENNEVGGKGVTSVVADDKVVKAENTNGVEKEKTTQAEMEMV